MMEKKGETVGIREEELKKRLVPERREISIAKPKVGGQ